MARERERERERNREGGLATAQECVPIGQFDLPEWHGCFQHRATAWLCAGCIDGRKRRAALDQRQRIKGHVWLFEARRSRCQSESELKLVTVEGQSCVSLSGAAAAVSTTTSSPQRFCPHCCSGLYSADSRCFWSTDQKKQRSTSLCPQHGRRSTASLLPPAPRPPLPSLLILWIYLLMASLLIVPPISGISSPVRADHCHSMLLPHQLRPVGLNLPREGGREKAHRLVLFTLLARVLLSSTMISVSIPSARHLLDSTAVSVFG